MIPDSEYYPALIRKYRYVKEYRLPLPDEIPTYFGKVDVTGWSQDEITKLMMNDLRKGFNRWVKQNKARKKRWKN